MPWNKWLYVQQKGYTKDEVLLIALDSGIDIAPGINVAPGIFGKNMKHSP